MIMTNTYQAKGKKVGIRPLTIEDSPLVVRWRNNPRVQQRYIYREPFTLEGQEQYYREQVESGEVIQFVITENETGRPIGCVVFHHIDAQKKCAEVGYFIGEDDAAHRGYGSEALKLGVHYGFAVQGWKEMYGVIFKDNEASIRGSADACLYPEEDLPQVKCTDGVCRDMVKVVCRKDPLTAQLVSFVIPCYHSEKTIGGVVAEIEKALLDLPQYREEIIMVNDGADAATWGEIKRLCRERSSRRGICLARNFGQHSALMAGIRKAKGSIIVCLDDDGQTPADEVGGLLKAVKDGADVAMASYEKAHDSAFRSFGTWINEKMCRLMLGKPADLQVTSYFAMRRFVADEVLRYRNSYPYLLGLILRATRNIVNVPVHHRKREVGRSGYTFGKLLALWMNGFTAFSVQPLRIATWMGAFFAVVSFLYGIYTIIKRIVNPAVPMGFSALMTAIIFFGGMLMLMVGLAGEYVGRTYISVNDAPQYVIRETTDTDVESDR